MGITARNFAALLILVNLFSWHRLLLVLGDRSLSILSSFLEFITLFLPGFTSGNWEQKKKIVPTLLPFSMGIRLLVYFRNSLPAQIIFPITLGEQGWRSGESARLPPMWPRPVSNPGVEAICGLSLLLVLSLAPRGFSPGTPVFPSPQSPTLPNSNSIWKARTRLNEFIQTLKCFVGKKALYNFFFLS